VTIAQPVPASSTAPALPAHKLLSGQRALVTGANSGIGRGVAIGLAQAGADVMVNYVDGDDAASAVVEEIRRSGARASAYQADVSSEEQVAAMFEGGIKLLMESMAQELAPQRIRVNAIAPGAIRTPINTAAWQTPEAYARLMTLVPYGRIGEPEDIARAAVWLASDHSDYVVGTTLFIDGGMTLYPGFATGG
jgi:NAD(P)-dependent dehydrogenase (short-subunit alcohol dehydrogenase family)